MQLLEIAKQCCFRTGDNTIKTLFNTDDNSTSWQGYMQQAAKLICKEHNWQKLKREETIITFGSTNKYPLPDDFEDIQTYKIYNITNNRYILPETDDEAYAKLAAKNYSQTSIHFRIINDEIVFTYPIDNGLELKYSYNTKNICKLGNVYKDAFSDDADEFLLSDELLILKAMALRAVDLGLPEREQREIDYQKFLKMEMASDGANIYYLNKYDISYINKTTPVEYSIYD